MNSFETMFAKPSHSGDHCYGSVGNSLLQTGKLSVSQLTAHSRGLELEDTDNVSFPEADPSSFTDGSELPSLGHLHSSSNRNSSTIYFTTEQLDAQSHIRLVTFAANVSLAWEEERLALSIAGRPVLGAFQEWQESSCDAPFEWNPGAAYSKWTGDIPYFGSTREQLHDMGDGALSIDPAITWQSLQLREAASVRYLWQELFNNDKPAIDLADYKYSRPFETGGRLVLRLMVPATPAPSEGWPVILDIPGGQWGYHAAVSSEVPATLQEFFNVSKSFAIASISVRQMNQGYYPFPEAVQHPAELEDAVAAFQYLVANAALMHINPHRIVVHGFSSGGNVAALLPVALAREPELANHTQLFGAMIMHGASDLLSLQADRIGHFDIGCDNAASQLIGCGTLGVSIQNLADMLSSIDLLLTAAGLPHELGSHCRSNLTQLAKLREDDVYEELVTSIALARSLAMQELSEDDGFANVTKAAERIVSLDTDHGALNLTTSLIRALAASPAVQIAGAHAEGHRLPPYYLHHAKKDADIPSIQSWRLVASLQESGTDFTIFMSQFGEHTTYTKLPPWQEFMLQNDTSQDNLQQILVHHDLVKLLLPAWLEDISFFDMA